eukprot:CAMPEP_0198473302 /NCGR_PEP_ID=MMETSP1456-20131121/34205_1 /TAXON_ID=1461544 ORGANISM="Unidentified sp., Strain RCC1871" /NCGR_SAMPLE_ID=MMETSP1456 /ASSEMBLY_ACC=CAM_ASM_001119 /LENGTH=393 /DNA_ID=CAMNT_0044199959 /DNA_START=15 /DNA_END=1192 /DNA_ORIENTATION=-
MGPATSATMDSSPDRIAIAARANSNVVPGPRLVRQFCDRTTLASEGDASACMNPGWHVAASIWSIKPFGCSATAGAAAYCAIQPPLLLLVAQHPDEGFVASQPLGPGHPTWKQDRVKGLPRDLLEQAVRPDLDHPRRLDLQDAILARSDHDSEPRSPQNVRQNHGLHLLRAIGDWHEDAGRRAQDRRGARVPETSEALFGVVGQNHRFAYLCGRLVPQELAHQAERELEGRAGSLGRDEASVDDYPVANAILGPREHWLERGMAGHSPALEQALALEDDLGRGAHSAHQANVVCQDAREVRAVPQSLCAGHSPRYGNEVETFAHHVPNHLIGDFVTCLEQRTALSASTDATLTSIPALLRTSARITASISSVPFATGTRAVPFLDDAARAAIL